jgi:hypothetical protein
MKTNLSLLFLLLVAGSYKLGAQTQEDKYPETAIIRLIETNPGIVGAESKMIVINPENHMEMKPLNNLKFSRGEDEGVAENAQKLRTEIQLWHNKGFQVKTMSSVATGYNILTTVILQKN